MKIKENNSQKIIRCITENIIKLWYLSNYCYLLIFFKWAYSSKSKQTIQFSNRLRIQIICKQSKQTIPNIIEIFKESKDMSSGRKRQCKHLSQQWRNFVSLFSNWRKILLIQKEWCDASVGRNTCSKRNFNGAKFRWNFWII